MDDGSFAVDTSEGLKVGDAMWFLEMGKRSLETAPPPEPEPEAAEEDGENTPENPTD